MNEVKLIRARMAAELLAVMAETPGQRAAVAAIREYLEDAGTVAAATGEAAAATAESKAPAKAPVRRPRSSIAAMAKSDSERDRKEAEEEMFGEEERRQKDRAAIRRAVSGSDDIPAAIRAAVAAGFNQSRLAAALELDPAAVSRAAAGKFYPYVARAFRQHFQVPRPDAAAADMSKAEARLKAIRE